jgi:hypothetical protein
MGACVDGNHLTFFDPYKGVNAFNIANILNSSGKSVNVLLDLGPGIGSDAINVSKLVNSPTLFILMDIPLNLTTAFAYVSMNTGYDCDLIDSEDELSESLVNAINDHKFIFVLTKFVEVVANQIETVDLLFNHGSFSEMDQHTVSFYLDTLLAKGPVVSMFEINSNSAIENTGGHIEVPSSQFKIPPNFDLIMRVPTINNEFGHGYVQSFYRRRDFFVD